MNDCMNRWLAHLQPHLAHSVTPSDWKLVGRFETDVQSLVGEETRDEKNVLTDLPAVKRKLACQGYGGIDVAIQHGGRGRSALVQMLIQFICGYYDVDLRDAAHVGHGRIVLAAGTEAQRCRWGPRMLTGELIGIAATEHRGGSNMRGVGTVAYRCAGGQWCLSGQKIWISRIEEASAFVTFFKIAGESLLTAAIVEAGAPGISRTRLQPTGLSGWSWGRLHFEEVPVERGDFLCTPGHGNEVFRRHFDYYRPIVAITALGGAAAAYDKVVQQLRDRLRAGAITGVKDSVAETVASSFTQIHSAVLAVMAAQHEVSTNSSQSTTWSRVVKGYGVETANRVVSSLALLAGASAFQVDNELAKVQRDLRGFMYADGIHDVLLQSAGQRLLRAHS